MEVNWFNRETCEDLWNSPTSAYVKIKSAAGAFCPTRLRRGWAVGAPHLKTIDSRPSPNRARPQGAFCPNMERRFGGGGAWVGGATNGEKGAHGTG